MREAIVHLGDDEVEALGFGDLVSHCRAAGIRELDLLEDDGYTCAPQVTVEDRLDGELLEELECVDGWELVAAEGDAYRYVLELTATELSEAIVEDHAELLGQCDPAVVEEGLVLSMLGSQEAIRDVIRHFQDAGVTPELRKLGEYTGDGSTLDALTDRQLETISTAFELGFYEVPREASTEDVAAELGLDPGTVSEHLQRAERNVLRHALVG